MIALLLLALVGCSQAQDWNSDCGFGTFNVNHKIVGGQEARPNQFPWTVSLQRNGFHFCGGIIVSATTIVTAAHCRPSTSHDVVAGEHDLYANDGTEQTRSVRSVVYHPNNNPIGSLDYDVAVVKVSAFSMNYAVAAACKPSRDWNSGNAIVSGWGALSSGGSSPDELYYVSVPLITNAECNADYSGQISNVMLCAGRRGVGGVDACQGDSGGPLVRQVNGRYELVGDVSWGYGCADRRYPGVYGRIWEFRDWIDRQL